MKRRNWLYLIILILAAASIFTGCDSESRAPGDGADSPVQLIWKGAPEHTVAILINQPTAAQSADFAASERLVLEDSNESFLLIPAEEVEEIAIWKLEYDGSDFARTEAVYRNFDPDDDFILDLVVMRPEGGPHFELSLVSDKGEAAYYIAYDGKGADSNIEYILFD